MANKKVSLTQTPDFSWSGRPFSRFKRSVDQREREREKEMRNKVMDMVGTVADMDDRKRYATKGKQPKCNNY